VRVATFSGSITIMPERAGFKQWFGGNRENIEWGGIAGKSSAENLNSGAGIFCQGKSLTQTDRGLGAPQAIQE